MGIKPNAAHIWAQIPELCASEDVFSSDNHSDKKIFLLSLQAEYFLGSGCGFKSFI